jgi:PAS domain S-box-containing protein
MSPEKPTYEELKARLAEAESFINAIRNEQIDAVLARKNVYVVRLKEMEEALQESNKKLCESEERFRCLAENIQDVFWLRTPDKMLYISPMYEKLWGRSCASLYENPSSFLDAVHPEDRTRVERSLVREQSTGARFDEEYRVIQPDGSLRWIRARSFPVAMHFEAGWSAGVAQDITERKQAEAALLESEARLNTVLDTLPVGVVIADADGKIIRDNAATRELWGVPPETDSWDGYGNWVGWWPETGERIKAEEWAMTRALVHGEETRNELILNQRFDNQERRYYLNNVSPLRNAEGGIIGGVAAMLDITERKRGEDELREAEQKHRDLIRHAPTAIFEVDFVRRRLTSVNDAMCQMLGYNREELLVMDPFDLMDEEGQAQLQTKMAKWLKGKRPSRQVEYRVRTKDGRMLDAALNVTYTRDEKGNPSGATVIAHDVTERKRAENVLRKAHGELEHRVKERTAELEKLTDKLIREIETRKKFEADLQAQGKRILAAYRQRDYLSRRLVDLLERERNEIGSALHDEVGQILAGASMQLEALKEMRTEDESGLADWVEAVQELLRHGMRHVRGLSHNLRSDVLNRFGLIPSVRNLVDELQRQAPLKIHFFSKNVPEDLKEETKDLTIYRLVQESLTNVLKHAEAKEVFINLNGRDGKVLLSIEDDGKGFDYQGLSKKGELFETSLGIAIMRERTSMVGGQFHVESKPGKGTCVMAEIPIR